MVYCGKPSNSCHACRERKTRCDARPGGCTQCERVNRKCPGYRSQIDLIFRDQSHNVERRVKARAAKNSLKKRSPKPSPPVSDTEGEARSLESQWQLVAYPPEDLWDVASLNPTLEDRATCYFLYNHAMGITIPGYGDITNMTATHMIKIMDPTLAASLSAASLASYAHYVRSSDLAITSRYHYTKAIQLTNTALASPVDAKKDSTLFSVLLLSLYEVLTGRNERSIEDWARHVHGAATLLKMRGHDQFEFPVGRRMFVQATSSLLASCLQRGIRLPEYIMGMMDELEELMKNFGDLHLLGLRAFKIMLGCNQFVCDMNDGTLTDPEAMIARALELDGPLADVCRDPPPEWRFEVISGQNTKPDIVFDDCYHVYATTWVVSMWSPIRMFRILLHHIIREILLKGFAAKPPMFTSASYTSQFQRSTEICLEMQGMILSSVPQALGFVRSTGVWDEADDTFMHNANGTPTATHIISAQAEGPSYSGYIMLWPLWYAGWVKLATDEVRAYCVKNLRRIGENMGIQQAFIFASVIETNMEPKAWGQGDLESRSPDRIPLH